MHWWKDGNIPTTLNTKEEISKKVDNPSKILIKILFTKLQPIMWVKSQRNTAPEIVLKTEHTYIVILKEGVYSITNLELW